MEAREEPIIKLASHRLVNKLAETLYPEDDTGLYPPENLGWHLGSSISMSLNIKAEL